MSDKERKIVSYHEVGHALVSALQKNTEPVQKITIVPRTMGALGYTLRLLRRRNTLRQRTSFSPKSQHIWQDVPRRCWYLTQSQAEPQMI